MEISGKECGYKWHYNIDSIACQLVSFLKGMRGKISQIITYTLRVLLSCVWDTNKVEEIKNLSLHWNATIDFTLLKKRRAKRQFYFTNSMQPVSFSWEIYTKKITMTILSFNHSVTLCAKFVFFGGKLRKALSQTFAYWYTVGSTVACAQKIDWLSTDSHVNQLNWSSVLAV